MLGVGSGCIESMVAGRLKDAGGQKRYIVWILCVDAEMGLGDEHKSASEYTQGRGPAKTAHKTWLGERKEEGRKEGGGQSSRRDSRVIRCS